MELLVKIFGLYICPDSLEEGIYARRQHLASISRRWKDVVLHTPTFWKCTIHTPSTSPFLNTRSERSGQALLDIQRILKFSVAFVCVCLYSTGYSTKRGTIPSFLYTVLKAEALYVQFEISIWFGPCP